MNSENKILITGATGFIGSHLSRELVEKDYSVFGLFSEDKISNKIINLLTEKKKFCLEKGDIRNFEKINQIVKKNDIGIIIHLAAILPGDKEIEDPFNFFEINARGTLNLLNIAYKNKIKRFIYSSTNSVYSEPPEYLPVDENHPTRPPTIYGVSKLEGELYCGVYSKEIDITVLRYCGAYGKVQDEHYATYRFVKQALNNEPITIYGDGSQTTDFTHIDDIIQGTILAMEKNKPGIYNISSGKETSIKELAEKIISITNSKSKISFIDKETNKPFRFFLNIEKARNNLGYSPLSLEEGLKKYILDFK
jgi:UDP-glucose 4-epimerase